MKDLSQRIIYAISRASQGLRLTSRCGKTSARLNLKRGVISRFSAFRTVTPSSIDLVQPTQLLINLGQRQMPSVRAADAPPKAELASFIFIVQEVVDCALLVKIKISLPLFLNLTVLVERLLRV